MSEKIAMTPPDCNGDQTYWIDHSSIFGGRVLAPTIADSPPDILEKLIIASRAEGLSDISFLGKRLAYTMNSFVLSDGSTVFRVDHRGASGSYARNFERSLRWIASNQMLANALRIPGLPDLESGYGEYSGLTITTPDYLGLMATSTPRDGFLCITAMSDESQGRAHPEEDVNCTLIRPELDRSCLAALNFAYPKLDLYRPGRVRLDGHEGNVLVGDNDVVRLDIDAILGVDV